MKALRATVIVLIALANLEILASLIRPKLFLNLSASMPQGIYGLRPLQELKRGTLVLFHVPPKTKDALRGRPWLREDSLLIKPIAALPGDSVCLLEHEALVRGEIMGNIYREDSEGLPLPRQRGCFIVDQDMVFPLSTHTAHSFDGRYFGEISLKEVLGEATPLFIW